MKLRQLICLTLALGFALPAPMLDVAQAQEAISESQWKRGFHGFYLIGEAAGLKQVTATDWRSFPPKKSVLVVFGDLKQSPLDIDRFVELGGAVLAATDKQAFLRTGVGFSDAHARARSVNNMFNLMPDCPVVRDIREHPALQGVETLVTNRPGVLRASRRATIAFHPPLQDARPSNAFIASFENSNGGQLLAVADPSIFTNQMIAYEDNDLFAYQSLLWLKGENRINILVISGGVVQPPMDPSAVRLSIPPPSRDEVLNALENLPPSAMIDFMNSVVNVVEDQNMVNEFIHDNMDKVSDVKVNRFLIFVFFGLICLTFVVGFLWQKKLLRQTASVVATQRAQREDKQRKSREAYERQWAAGVLFDSICIEFANRRYNEWPGFPDGLGLDGDLESNKVYSAMVTASNHFKTKPRSYWSRNRLEELEQRVNDWRDFLHQRATRADDEEIFDASAIGDA